VKNLRSFLLPAVLGAALIAPVAVFAQQANQVPAPAQQQTQGQWQGHRHGGHRFMRMLKGVNLSDQQKTQMRQLMQQFRQAHPEGSPPDRQAREQLHQQMLNILTPQQRAQVQQNMQQMRERRQQDRGNQPSPEASESPQD
jgi:periplasmic protein CpxP/Spy